ncbi:MAG: hypothetical protein LBO03_10100 [Acidaminococcales bacterium]|jgi:hypothetical protein|nr:hypothetical protein [Acidaminococcales bacterium]
MKEKASFSACFGIILMSLFYFASFALCPAAAFAEISQGRAVIINGNLKRAEEEARQDAMRMFVEKKISVSVDAQRLVVNHMAEVDWVMTKSSGYVFVKKVVRTWQEGDIFCIELDLEADEKKIKAAPKDIQEALAASRDDRGTVAVAVTGKNLAGEKEDLEELNNYLQSRLRLTGFRVVKNVALLQNIEKNAALPKAAQNNALRAVLRDETTARALVRGDLKVEEATGAGDRYKATVRASFEIISAENDDVDPYFEYVEDVGTTRAEAIRKAKEKALREASGRLAELALETMQDQQRGGVRHLEVILEFHNVTDANAQGQSIGNALHEARCDVIRKVMTKEGAYRFFIETTAYTSLPALQDALREAIPGLTGDGVNMEGAEGTSKIIFRFAGRA